MKKDKTTLKSYFETGDYPTEAQFVDLIDSFLNIEEEDAVTGIADNGDGTFTFQLLSGGQVTLNGATLPDDIPIANILGLQALLDDSAPDNFLAKDQDQNTTGGLSIDMAAFGDGKSFSIGAQGVAAYLSMDANGNAILGNVSSNDGQNSTLIVKRNGELEFDNNGMTHTIWHSGNDALIQRTDQSKNITNTAITHRYYSEDVLESSSGNRTALEVYQDTSGADAFMAFHISGDYAGYFGLKGDINDFAVGGWSYGNIFHRVWHEGNDGVGSGLDADKLDGTHGTYFDHRIYNDQNNYLGGGYISGGEEKPSFFERGKLKLQMLKGTNGNLGATPSYWNDVLWLSSYSGGDVKGSNALIFGKQTDAIGFCRQNYDSNSWGTYRAIWHSGANNITTGTCTATNFILSSDQRLKKNIRDIEDVKIDICWKTFSMAEGTEERYGVVAQELEKTHPKFVRTDEEGYKSVAYIDLLVAKMAEKDRQMLKLNNKIEKKDKRITLLTKRLDEMEIRVKKILATI